MSRPEPTSTDVAQLAGVSQSAVSRAFTEGASISEAKRARVIEAAEQLGYRPNLIARSLITRRTGIIGLAVGDLSNPFYSQLIYKLSEKLQQRNFHLLLFTVPDRANSDDLLEDVINYRLDALVLTSTEVSSHLGARLQERGIPVVLINRTTEDTASSSVASDNEFGASEVARFLVKQGHRRLAYVAGIQNTSTNIERERGFLRALASVAGVTVQHISGDYDVHKSLSVARELFDGENAGPEAIFCANDMMALSLMDALRYNLNLRVPEDVSVVGYDNIEPAAFSAYQLTTYSQPIDEMVDAAVELIVERVSSPGSAPRQIRLRGELVVRASVGVRHPSSADTSAHPSSAASA
ncbi:LacI family DNA-binding transcriptional regulator [Subtercola lobariae]|uniref:LacI family transcriptional regulator n=1 Tax=Subtercola lobariae TaxID=1588641 RepID=A0A917B207_9MICO|nr:LacI family DNA-binding transcriptional regulator [Subtercola lobariae]GGF15807.1 LacI family transcriptional regulator [Subtercola lobariae]